MSEYYKVGGTDCWATSETEAIEQSQQFLSEIKLPVKCKGTLIFGDAKIAKETYFYLVYEMENSVFYVPSQFRSNPIYFDLNFQDDFTLVFDFHRFCPANFVEENIEVIKKVVATAIDGSIIFEVGSNEFGIKSYILGAKKS